jgi:phosphatidylethanolamine/phosphatidyl-N-methylethanolamine N-methyltransferase
MPLPALRHFEQQIERQLRLLELKKTVIERNIGRQIRMFERKRGDIGKKIEEQIRQFERRRGIRLDDEVSFLRSWIERPLTIGAVTPSGKMLARTMARYVDPARDGPIVELGPGTGPVTAALLQAGIAPSRLVLVEFNPAFCKILRTRYPDATLVQGDAYSLRRLLETLLLQPAAAVVSSLPLVTKPVKMRLRLVRDAFDLMQPGAPFVQFTYGLDSPVPRRLGGFSAEASERIWMNIPPARVWVYRRAERARRVSAEVRPAAERR